MKVFLLILSLLICSEAYARSKTVVVGGYGTSQDEALGQAKKNAIESATGSWVATEENLLGDTLTRRSTSFSVGIIESFKILKASDYYVEIEARVVDRDDVNLKIETQQLSDSDRDKMNQLKSNNDEFGEAARFLDDVSSAIEFVTEKLQIDPSGENIQIIGYLRYKEEWKIKYNTLVGKSNRDIPLGNLFRCIDHVDGKLTILNKNKEILTSRDLKLTLGGSGLFSRSLPDLNLRNSYTLSQPNVDNLDSVNITIYCK